MVVLFRLHNLTLDSSGLQMDTVLFEKNVADGPAALHSPNSELNSGGAVFLGEGCDLARGITQTNTQTGTASSAVLKQLTFRNNVARARGGEKLFQPISSSVLGTKQSNID